MSKPRVLIVGAGAAGIAATARLLESGFNDIIVLEAGTRIGGRIHSVDFAGGVAELGAQWCHGEKGNIVNDLVKSFNLLTPSSNSYDDFTFYESSGKLLPRNVTDKLFKIACEISHDDEALSSFNGSFGGYFSERFRRRVMEEFKGDKESHNIASEFVEWYQKLIICLDAAPSWFDLSARGLLHYKECDGDKYLHWGNRGYKTILDVLMRKYPNPANQLPIDDKIFFKKEVVKIVWDNNYANKGGVSVECADGSLYSADHAILTFSLGMLKRKFTYMFSPQLPQEKQNAITGLGFGTVNKILLEFPDQWWPPDCKGFNFMWTNKDREDVLTKFPALSHLTGRSWLEDVFGFHTIDSHPNVLLGWIVGNQVEEIEALSNKVITDGCMYLLRKFLGFKYSIPSPCNMIRSSWKSHPHFFGSYSYRSNLSEELKVSASDLSEPVVANSKQVLLFSGEATHPIYYSTVHGAIESGFREADRLLNIYGHPEILRTKVVILGAGMAGLGAADKFTEEGFSDFIIVESQEEAGGRVKTDLSDYGGFDVGAQWIHGTDNPIYNIAKKYNLLSLITSEEGLGMYVRNDGFIFENDLVKQVDFEVGKILEECEHFVDAVDYPKSVGNYLDEKFSEYREKSESLSDSVSGQKLELLDWHVRFQLIDNSCLDLKELSAKEWGKYSCPGSDGQAHINLRYGYQTIVQAILSRFSRGKLRLNCPVTHIKWRDVLNNVRIYCEDELLIYCDHVIVTASLGVLKHCASNLFEPPLPPDLSKTIECMGFNGGIGKIFLVFEKKWWKTEGFQLLWRQDTVLSGISRWTRYISGFDLVVNYPNVLLGWVGGQGVLMMESLSEEDIGIHCVDLLRSVLKMNDIPYPTKVIRSQWTTNPWIRGGYSYTTTQCDILKLGPSNLSKPVVHWGVPRILLAGEACHPNHFSTTHGAFQSGQNQAKVILDYFNEMSKCGF